MKKPTWKLPLGTFFVFALLYIARLVIFPDVGGYCNNLRAEEVANAIFKSGGSLNLISSALLALILLGLVGLTVELIRSLWSKYKKINYSYNRWLVWGSATIMVISVSLSMIGVSGTCISMGYM